MFPIFSYFASPKTNTVHIVQTQKDNTRKVILEVARQEFFNHGFKSASMRKIANKADVGLSNIYNYFKNKDEILRDVLTPLLTAIDKVMDAHNKPEHINTNTFTSDQYWSAHVNNYVDLIFKYREEYNLLLFKSHGSYLENYKDEYIDKNTKIGIEYLEKMKDKYPWVNVDISYFFIHTMSSWWLSIIGEIISHQLNRSEIETFFMEFAEFSTAGWKKIMQI